MKNKKIITILGPTASGKTEWGIKIAKKFKGEVICADSRTVYKYLDIGTAKPKGRKCSHNYSSSEGAERLNREVLSSRLAATRSNNKKDYGCRVVNGVKHYLLDFVDPKKTYTVADFQRDALLLIKKISQKGKIPIIVGGTALYIYALTKGYQFRGKSDRKLRKELEGKSVRELQSMVKKIEEISLNRSDFQNKRRLIRAVERISNSKLDIRNFRPSPLPYSVLKIGISFPREKIYRRIDKRTKGWFTPCHSEGDSPKNLKRSFALKAQDDKKLTKDIIEETKRLLDLGVSETRINEIGLGYREVLKYLKGEIKSQKELEKRINFAQHAYVRRQMTWFKKDKDIHWIKKFDNAEKLVESFLFFC